MASKTALPFDAAPKEELEKAVGSLRTLVRSALCNPATGEKIYRMDQVRFNGIQSYGVGAVNVPDVTVNIDLLYQPWMSSDLLGVVAELIVASLSVRYKNISIIVKIQAGNVWGLAKIGLPDPQ